MSGGSYNYICFKGADELMTLQHEVESMADRLAGLGYAQDAALETQMLLLTLRQFVNRIDAITKRLGPVWQAVEWWDSCDSGEDGVIAALKTYRGEDQACAPLTAAGLPSKQE